MYIMLNFYFTFNLFILLISVKLVKILKTLLSYYALKLHRSYFRRYKLIV